MENKTKTIRIFGKEIATTDGKKFVKWSYTKDGVTFYDVKFARNCLQVPTVRGYWLVTFDISDCRKQKGKKTEKFTYNDTLWIMQTLNIAKDDKYEAEVAEQRLQELEDIL